MSASPSALTRKKWRSRGYYVETTEHFSQVRGGLPRRQDLFGFVDLLAIPTEGGKGKDRRAWVFIQTTSWSNALARVKKIYTGVQGTGQWVTPMREIAGYIVDRGDQLLVEGWRKGKKGIWEAREIWITPQDLQELQ